jgi:hypothetical protein
MFKMIRAGERYNPVILVTPPDAGPRTPNAQFFELSRYKDNHPARSEKWKVGEFNEIDAGEALMAFCGQADGWGFADCAQVHFPTIKDAETWVLAARKNPKIVLLSGHWFLSFTEFDATAKTIEGGRPTMKLELAATNEATAVHEAQLEWAKVLAKGTHQGWDKETYPQNPKVFYEIPWPTL